MPPSPPLPLQDKHHGQGNTAARASSAIGQQALPKSRGHGNELEVTQTPGTTYTVQMRPWVDSLSTTTTTATTTTMRRRDLRLAGWPYHLFLLSISRYHLAIRRLKPSPKVHPLSQDDQFQTLRVAVIVFVRYDQRRPGASKRRLALKGVPEIHRPQCTTHLRCRLQDGRSLEPADDRQATRDARGCWQCLPGPNWVGHSQTSKPADQLAS